LATQERYDEGQAFMTARSSSLSALAASYSLTLGCATTPDIDIIVHEVPKGAVYLERDPDRSFHASHPAMVDQALIARALQGVIARDESTAVQSVLSKTPAALRAFTVGCRMRPDKATKSWRLCQKGR
jgi:hypothetical protein